MSPRMPTWVFFLLPWGAPILGFAIRERSLLYGSNVNLLGPQHPCLVLPKSVALNAVPAKFRPKAATLDDDASPSRIRDVLAHNGLTWPLVVKPNWGKRGEGLAKVGDFDELVDFVSRAGGAVLVQEYVDLPLELGVLYYRYPGQRRGTISSIAIKELLGVSGDGTSTVKELVENERDRRYRYFLDRRRRKLSSELLQTVPGNGERVILDFVGQPCHGATMHNGAHLRTRAVERTFDRICCRISGFHFGRLDVKAASLEAFQRGESIQVLEVNGVGSVPLHVLDPELPLLRSYRDLFGHARIVARIARANRRRGRPRFSVTEGIRAFRKP